MPNTFGETELKRKLLKYGLLPERQQTPNEFEYFSFSEGIHFFEQHNMHQTRVGFRPFRIQFLFENSLNFLNAFTKDS